MARTYYSDYVTHCMRFYVRYPEPTFQSEAARRDWYACSGAMQLLPEDERDILTEVYRRGDTVPDNVRSVAWERRMNQDRIWKMIARLVPEVAKRRGLL